MSEKLVIIDGNSIFYRSFYALPLLSNSDGEYSNAVYGFAIQVINIISNIKPKYLVVAFDAGKHTFRNDLYDGYKATRKPMPPELKSQLERLKKMLSLMNITMIERLGIEGDDIIGIVSKKFKDVETIIVTGDRDSLQLVDEKTKVYITKKGTSDVKIIGENELLDEFGVTASQFIDLKALQGDTSDNIPGVSGIGPKTATSLIQKYGDLDGIYAHIDEITGKTKEKLLSDKENAYLSKKLATILTEGELDVSLSDLGYDFPFSGEVYEMFKHFQFKSLLSKENIFSKATKIASQISYETIKIITEEKLDELTSLITKNGSFAFHFYDSSLAISMGDKEFLIERCFDLFCESLSDEIIFAKLKPIFESNEILKICFNSKNEMYHLEKFGVSLENYFDTAIAKYLVDGVPITSLYDLFFEEKQEFVSVKLYNFMIDYKTKIERDGLEFLFYNVEIPLSKVLYKMEKYGFKVDRSVLNSLKEKYSAELMALEKEIHELAGEKFNINSPKQLAVILYDKLGLPHGKKKSTSAEVLEEISGMHAIVNSVLRYRKVAKFLGTYIDGMMVHIGKDDLIHTSFTQTLTSTGRLSSVEPNLQNIPIRSNESREIRSMFIASKPDNVLIDADYSQIELRLLAHCSEDPNFIDAFENDIDIHKKTATTVFGVSPDDVTDEMRRTAKVVNFGIIYGISDFGLADDLKIGIRHAKKLIDNFYEVHPAIDRYMKEQIEKAKQTGKAVTLFGRQRKMVDINASNFMVRSRAERASQNMPLQGTAADIIKIAMVNTYHALEKEGLSAKLIMQVHDELIIDCPILEKDKVIEILKREMVCAAKLKVKLEVDVKSSFRWSDGH